MARLRKPVSEGSDDDLPDLAKLLGNCRGSTVTQIRSTQRKERRSPRRKPYDKNTCDSTAIDCRSKSLSETPTGASEPTANEQLRQLQPIDLNTVCLADTGLVSSRCREASLELPLSVGIKGKRSSPKRSTKSPIYNWIATSVDHETSTSEDEGSFTDLSGFIVSDNESSDEKDECITRTKSKQNSYQGLASKGSRSKRRLTPSRDDLKQVATSTRLSSTSRHVSDSQKSSEDNQRKQIQVNDPNLSDLEDRLAILKFSPPRFKSPSKVGDKHAKVTPPSSPSKSRLQSPPKKLRIPPTPHRPSIDAFWSQEVINDWNDEYSPRKTPMTARKNRFILEDSDSDIATPPSPTKSPSKSPAKKDKIALAKRKAFDSSKQEIANSFLAEVDSAITGGEVGRLADATGGIKLVWSKKLNSTAGRASWRREAVRHRRSDGSVSETSHRHHASIELAEKVINNETRLLNVIAHEYCHLANFMISGVKNNPHGKEFKKWAAKCSAKFEGRGVTVTAKHTYEIDYKFVRVCENGECGTEYQRHSRSIDPRKHFCGKCKGKLVQVKPAPRKKVGEGEDGGGKRSEYQIFVKEEYERVKREMPGAGFGGIMAELGRRFRERKKEVVEKGGGAKTEDAQVADVLRGLDGLKLDASPLLI